MSTLFASMLFTRRQILAAAAASFTIAPGARSQEPGPRTLRIGRARAELLGQGEPASDVWSLGATWPPPVLEARQGEEFTLRLVNDLAQPVALHWHGVRGPAAMMNVRIEPGESNGFEMRFTPPDAGTFWLSPIENVSRMREMGIGAMLVVAEREPPDGIVDQSLVIDDWKLSEEGTVIDDFGDLEEAIGQGRLGNWFTVNGSFRPRIAAPRDRPLRLRILNAANVRTTSLQFKGAEPRLLALDGQPVPPRPLERALALAPAQRADLLIEPQDTDVTVALDLFEDTVEIAYLTRTGSGPAATVPSGFALPANPIAGDFDGEGARRVTLRLEGGAKGGLKSAIYRGETLDVRALLERGQAWAMNGVAGIPAEPWQRLERGESVIVDIENATAFEQPLHLQGHVWREVASGETGPYDWRDTALVGPKKRLALGFVADNPGTWGLHSTIAERIDSGMITTFAVE